MTIPTLGLWLIGIGGAAAAYSLFVGAWRVRRGPSDRYEKTLPGVLFRAALVILILVLFILGSQHGAPT